MPWSDELASSMYDNGGVQTPLTEHPFVKESPDLGHFVSKSLETQKEIGRRVPLAKVETPEARAAWQKENLPKFYAAGLLEGPPSDVKEYGVKRPENFPEHLWNDERAGKFTSLLQKYNLPKGAAAEFLALHDEAFATGQKILKTDYDSAMVSLKREFGDKFDEKFEAAGRFWKDLIHDPGEIELINNSGLGDHPKFLSVIMRLATLAQSDTSGVLKGVMSNAGAPASTHADVRAEVAKAMTDPTHPMYNDYIGKTDRWEAWATEQYGKAFPDKVGKTLSF